MEFCTYHLLTNYSNKERERFSIKYKGGIGKKIKPCTLRYKGKRGILARKKKINKTAKVKDAVLN